MTVRSKKVVVLVLVSALLAMTGCSGGVEVIEPQYNVLALNDEILRARSRVPVQQVEDVTLPAGTLFPIRLLDTLGTKINKVNDRFYVEVTEDVRVGNVVVIPMGSRGQGRVTEVQPARGSGKSGTIQFELEFIQAINNRRVAVHTTERTAAQDREVWGVGTVIGTLFLGPLYLLAPFVAKGKDIEIRQYVQFYVETRRDETLPGYIY